jgi:hypothetical protein
MTPGGAVQEGHTDASWILRTTTERGAFVLDRHPGGPGNVIHSDRGQAGHLLTETKESRYRYRFRGVDKRAVTR